MILYFADRKMSILGSASTGLPEGLTVLEDLKSEDVETGATTFECKIPFRSETRELAESCAAVGNYIFRYDGDANEFYTIVESEVDAEAASVSIYAEDAGLDLINEVALQWPTSETASSDRGTHTLEWYITKLLSTGTYGGGDTGGGDTGFELGINEAEDDAAQQLTWDSESTVTERLLEIATAFGCEIAFRFEIDGMAVTHKYVDVFKKRGKDLGVQLRMGMDVQNIVTKTSIANLATALKVTGADNAAGVPVNLEGYTYDDGEYYVAPGSLLRSRTAHDKWSRYISLTEPETVNNGYGDVVKTFTYDTVDQTTLCQKAVEELKKVCEPEVNYEVELYRLPDGVKIGDRVTIVDDEGEQYLSARILKLETSVADNTRSATLGEYLIRDSGISARVEALASEFSTLAKKRPFYTWVAYADDDTGTGISPDPEGKSYMGIAANQTVPDVDTSDPSVFTWQRTEGVTGADGEDGEDAVLLRIDSSHGTVFKNTGVSTVLSVVIYMGSQRITTSQQMRAAFGAGAHLVWEWLRLDDERYVVIPADDSRLSDGGFSLTLGVNDVDTKVTFRCSLEI